MECVGDIHNERQTSLKSHSKTPVKRNGIETGLIASMTDQRQLTLIHCTICILNKWNHNYNYHIHCNMNL